jgi:hypothetical protein
MFRCRAGTHTLEDSRLISIFSGSGWNLNCSETDRQKSHGFATMGNKNPSNICLVARVASDKNSFFSLNAYVHNFRTYVHNFSNCLGFSLGSTPIEPSYLHTWKSIFGCRPFTVLSEAIRTWHSNPARSQWNSTRLDLFPAAQSVSPNRSSTLIH